MRYFRELFLFEVRVFQKLLSRARHCIEPFRFRLYANLLHSRQGVQPFVPCDRTQKFSRVPGTNQKFTGELLCTSHMAQKSTQIAVTIVGDFHHSGVSAAYFSNFIDKYPTAVVVLEMYDASALNGLNGDSLDFWISDSAATYNFVSAFPNGLISEDKMSKDQQTEFQKAKERYNDPKTQYHFYQERKPWLSEMYKLLKRLKGRHIVWADDANPELTSNDVREATMLSRVSNAANQHTHFLFLAGVLHVNSLLQKFNDKNYSAVALLPKLLTLHDELKHHQPFIQAISSFTLVETNTTFPKCQVCTNPGVSKCSNCKATNYCSRLCQKISHTTHKAICKKQ